MEKKKLVFITGNKNKLIEVQAMLPNVVGKKLDLPEIQEVDARLVIREKLLEAYKHHKGEYIVEDTSLYIACLNDLPGPLIKWFWEGLRGEKIFEIVKKLKDDKVVAKTIFGYIDSKKEIKFFEGVVKGRIVKPKGSKRFSWDVVFMPDGFKKRFSEMEIEEKNKISMRKKALVKLKKYLER